MSEQNMNQLVEELISANNARLNFLETLREEVVAMKARYHEQRKNLKEELAGTLHQTVYQVRQDRERIREESDALIAGFKDTRDSMAKELRNELQDGKVELSGEVKELLQHFQKTRAHQANEQHETLHRFAESLSIYAKRLEEETTRMVRTFAKQRDEMSAYMEEELSSELGTRKREVAEFLESAREQRQSDFSQSMEHIRNDLSRLHKSITSLLEENRELLRSLEKNHATRAQSWKRVADLRTTAEKETREAIIKTIEEERHREKRSALKDSILETVTESGEGMKLTSIGEQLETAWRRLIPLVNELIEEELIQKDDKGFYFPVETNEAYSAVLKPEG